MFYAMTDWNGFYQDFQFVGFANFGEIFTDKPFWHSVWFTLKFVVVNLLLSNGAALALAYYDQRRHQRLYVDVHFHQGAVLLC